MNISQSVNQQITSMPAGHFFTYQDIDGFADNSYAVIKALSRQFKNLGVVKVKKGLFYKEIIGSFGPMAPKDSAVIEYFTTKDGETIGYITGPALYHRWGLTSQVPAELTIATSTNKREKVTIAGLRIITIPAQGEVTDVSIPLLQYLDVIKNISRIHDTDSQQLLLSLTQKLNRYSREQMDKMIDIAMRVYGAKTRALLGALLEYGLNRYSHQLHQSLNPTSRYKTGLAGLLPSDGKRWYLTHPLIH